MNTRRVRYEHPKPLHLPEGAVSVIDTIGTAWAIMPDRSLRVADDRYAPRFSFAYVVERWGPVEVEIES
jgi:hypothetical protein